MYSYKILQDYKQLQNKENTNAKNSNINVSCYKMYFIAFEFFLNFKDNWFS